MRRLMGVPLRLWRHPNGKPLYLVAIALAALYAGWLFVFQISLLMALALFAVFDD